MTITYYSRNEYGIIRHYFVDEAQAAQFKTISGRKTLDVKDIEILKSWGLKFKAVADPKAVV